MSKKWYVIQTYSGYENKVKEALLQRVKEHGKDRLEKATYHPGDYGRMIRPDGTEQWWVRSPKGMWIALRHQRVLPNEDGSITLLPLEI